MYHCVHNMYDAEPCVVTSGYIVLFMQQNKDIICMTQFTYKLIM